MDPSRKGKLVLQAATPQPSPTPNHERAGVSATTTNISNGSETHGNEGHDVTTLVAGRQLHGAKNNRVHTELSREAELACAPQRVSSHMTTTSTINATSAKVTRDRGIPVTTLSSSRTRSLAVALLCLVVGMTDPVQDPDPVTEQAVENHSDHVRQCENHRHHDHGLGHERQTGQPQLHSVPPVEEAVHPATLCARAHRRPRGVPVDAGVPDSR